MKHANFEIGTHLTLRRRSYFITDKGPTTRVLREVQTGNLRSVTVIHLWMAALQGQITFPNPALDAVIVRLTEHEQRDELQMLNAACPAGFVVVRRKDLDTLLRQSTAYERRSRQPALWATGDEYGTRPYEALRRGAEAEVRTRRRRAGPPAQLRSVIDRSWRQPSQGRTTG